MSSSSPAPAQAPSVRDAEGAGPLDPALGTWAGVATRAVLVPAARPVPPAFGDRYRPLALLGGGSYAEVFRARDTVTGGDVALKVLHDRVSDRAVWPARERFEREVAVMRLLTHASVVPVIDAGYLRDPMLDGVTRPALVMPIVEGETLATVIEQGRAWTTARVVAFLRETVGVLAHLQAHGVVHRDLGPQNIFVTAEGGYRISDFGMARPLDSAVVTRLSGTLTQQMANRLVYTDAANRDGVITGASDLVSLARVAIALLRGRHYAGPLAPGTVGRVPEALRELLNTMAADGAEGDPADFLRRLDAALVEPPRGSQRTAARPSEGAGPGAAGGTPEATVRAVVGPPKTTFTLVELLIVLAIIGTIASIMLPNLRALASPTARDVLSADLQTLATDEEIYRGRQLRAGGANAAYADAPGNTNWGPSPGVEVVAYQHGRTSAGAWWRATLRSTHHADQSCTLAIGADQPGAGLIACGAGGGDEPGRP